MVTVLSKNFKLRVGPLDVVLYFIQVGHNLDSFRQHVCTLGRDVSCSFFYENLIKFGSDSVHVFDQGWPYSSSVHGRNSLRDHPNYFLVLVIDLYPRVEQLPENIFLLQVEFRHFLLVNS